MENSNNKQDQDQDQDQDKDKDIKKDYTIETMDHNTAEELSDQQINAKLEKKPLYDNISNISSIPNNEIISEQIENNENNEEGLFKDIIK